MSNFQHFSDQTLNPGRLAMTLAYSGTRYQGWQAQKHADQTIQAHVQNALSRVADHPVEVVCAGRTDAGVHASGQVIHFDTSSARSPKAWAFGVNHHLPADIRVLWVGQVTPEFHARYCATSRLYRYVLLNQPVAPAWAIGNLGWYHKPLDEERMHHAAQALVGEHDFSAFRAAECQSRTPMRRLTELSVRRAGDLVWFEIRGNAFLHHMVRNIVGTLVYVGDGRQPVEWVADVLASRDRRRAGPTATASGLYFCHVEYPQKFGLPKDPFDLPFRSPACVPE